ncbi:hypothetical protein MTR_4g051562 [Medicago truncatula]|uniref:Uncharacterized protein n=1 Tax=Medicago truncatula TaxID=3880 RepID=A0A072UJ40_MEDTR|nr:hypothetical protein MTR_4g051562 [Medicago truncatula]
MKDSKLGDTPVAKGDKFCLKQCPVTDLEKEEMQNIPYASVLGSFIRSTSGYTFLLAGWRSRLLEVCYADFSGSLYHGNEIYGLFIGIESWNLAGELCHWPTHRWEHLEALEDLL